MEKRLIYSWNSHWQEKTSPCTSFSISVLPSVILNEKFSANFGKAKITTIIFIVLLVIIIFIQLVYHSNHQSKHHHSHIIIIILITVMNISKNPIMVAIMFSIIIIISNRNVIWFTNTAIGPFINIIPIVIIISNRNRYNRNVLLRPLQKISHGHFPLRYVAAWGAKYLSLYSGCSARRAEVFGCCLTKDVPEIEMIIHFIHTTHIATVPLNNNLRLIWLAIQRHKKAGDRCAYHWSSVIFWSF